MITVIDTGIGNLASVQRAFSIVGAQTCLSHDAHTLLNSDGIVLPGVGAFRDGMDSLRQHDLIEPLREAARSGIPILGFCLGMQLLADSSEEFGEYEGLGIIPSRVVALKPGPGERVPNIGWCDVNVRDGARLFHDVGEHASFYFVHSFYMECENPSHVAATIRFGSKNVTVAIEHNNIFGLQCHPEKSQDEGLKVLEQFIKVVQQHKEARS